MDKKLEAKRLWIYLFLTFGLTWAIFGIAISRGFVWDGSNPAMEQFIAVGMLMPFLGHVLTRAITKEGFALTGKDSMLLGISLKDGKWKYYLMAMLLPWMYFEISYLLQLLAVPEAFDPEYVVQMGMEKELAFVYPIVAITNASIVSFAALGEEAGWRAYMMPKLIKLMGLRKALLVGGVIWGLWHAPITCVGHNFGTDYPGFPYLGIFVMCVFCILIGVLLTYLTIRSQSVWPAAIMHAVNNAAPSILRFFSNDEIVRNSLPNPIMGFGTLLIPVGILAVAVVLRERFLGHKEHPFG